MNRIRTKIANELKNYGRRVQYSVFECELTEKKFGELYGKLAALLQQAQNLNNNRENRGRRWMDDLGKTASTDNQTTESWNPAEDDWLDHEPEEDPIREELGNWNQGMSESSNSIRVYRLCGACAEQIRIIGVEQRKKEDSDIIII